LLLLTARPILAVPFLDPMVTGWTTIPPVLWQRFHTSVPIPFAASAGDRTLAPGAPLAHLTIHRRTPIPLLLLFASSIVVGIRIFRKWTD
jgi:hypothetical protein